MKKPLRQQHLQQLSQYKNLPLIQRNIFDLITRIHSPPPHHPAPKQGTERLARRHANPVARPTQAMQKNYLIC
ncbi:hypothetical protein [Andreprevotia chitinilytica]|uniref:hypothetical protein n=1 Tax=Andreprevotia chitinilytica TaxID=396808 RepID=UPI00146FF318|nr:hypothetical protein [Andreprevotia chitinilytica]